MRRVKPGGLLVTSTCSHFVDHRAFMEMLKRTARAEGRDAWVVSERGAAKDHPVLLTMPETQYLSCTTLRLF